MLVDYFPYIRTDHTITELVSQVTVSDNFHVSHVTEVESFNIVSIV